MTKFAEGIPPAFKSFDQLSLSERNQRIRQTLSEISTAEAFGHTEPAQPTIFEGSAGQANTLASQAAIEKPIAGVDGN